jgi:hypothetical protein
MCVYAAMSCVLVAGGAGTGTGAGAGSRAASVKWHTAGRPNNMGKSMAGGWG